MIRYRFICLAIAITISPFLAFGGYDDLPQAEVKYFTLQDCIDYAISNNQSVKIA